LNFLGSRAVLSDRCTPLRVQFEVLDFGFEVGFCPILDRYTDDSPQRDGYFVILIFMSDEQSYRKKMESQLNDLGAQIHDLLNKVGSEVDKEVEALRPKLKAAQEKLDELKHTSSEAWGDLKPGLEKAWAELQKSFGQAAARFKTPRNKD
jgi:hypothetical protein